MDKSDMPVAITWARTCGLALQRSQIEGWASKVGFSAVCVMGCERLLMTCPGGGTPAVACTVEWALGDAGADCERDRDIDDDVRDGVSLRDSCDVEYTVIDCVTRLWLIRATSNGSITPG